MTTQTYAPQNQMYQQPAGQPAQGQRQSDPFWYRQNASYLYGVTSGPSNPQLGIENIQLKPSSPAQRQYGILFNGLLNSIIGSISFQVRLSPRTNAPFVQTISTESGVDNMGKKTYWEHVIIRPQVKAQVLRFAEALMSGQVQQPVQQPQYQQAPAYNQAPQYQQAPQYNQAPVYNQAPQYNQAPPMQGAPVYNQAPMQGQAPVQYPQYNQPAYTPPPAQDMGATVPNQEPAPEQTAPVTTPVDTTAGTTGSGLVEDDLPI